MIKLIKDELAFVSGSTICSCRIARGLMTTLNINSSPAALMSPAGCRRSCCELEEHGIAWAYYRDATSIKELGVAVATESGDCV